MRRQRCGLYVIHYSDLLAFTALSGKLIGFSVYSENKFQLMLLWAYNIIFFTDWLTLSISCTVLYWNNFKVLILKSFRRSLVLIKCIGTDQSIISWIYVTEPRVLSLHIQMDNQFVLFASLRSRLFYAGPQFRSLNLSVFNQTFFWFYFDVVTAKTKILTRDL